MDVCRVSRKHADPVDSGLALGDCDAMRCDAEVPVMHAPLFSQHAPHIRVLYGRLIYKEPEHLASVPVHLQALVNFRVSRRGESRKGPPRATTGWPHCAVSFSPSVLELDQWIPLPTRIRPYFFFHPCILLVCRPAWVSVPVRAAQQLSTSGSLCSITLTR